MKSLISTILVISSLVISSCGDKPQANHSAFSPEHATLLQSYIEDQDAGLVTEFTAYTGVPDAISSMMKSSQGREQLVEIAKTARSISFDGNSRAAHVVTRSSWVLADGEDMKHSVHECLVVHNPSSPDPMIWTFVSSVLGDVQSPINNLFVDSMDFDNDKLNISVHWLENDTRTSMDISVDWEALQSPNGIGDIDIDTGRVYP
ncbi:MAG: hypothetical protein ACSHX5_06825 [Phycisphaerales bacterium]